MHDILPKVVKINIKYIQQLRNNIILSHALFRNVQYCDAPLYVWCRSCRIHCFVAAPTQSFLIKELQPFLEMVNIYRRILPSTARTLWLLTEKLRGKRKGLKLLEAMALEFGRFRSSVCCLQLTCPTPQ
jgi:hypothetical protein